MHVFFFSRRVLRVCAAVVSLGFCVALSDCGGGGGANSIPVVTAAPTSPLQTISYAGAMTTQATWLDAQQLKDGAILYTSTEIEPYFANLAASGLTKVPGQLPQVRAWMKWFVAHINTSDIWNLGNTVYDYNYAGGVETSTQSADSVDSYNATFLTLARQLYDTGDATSRQYVASIAPTLQSLGQTILAIQQSDGLTIAMPSYQMAYLMDNSEVYRGLVDLAYLDGALGDASQETTFSNAAARVSQGIASLWDASTSTYAYAKGEPAGDADPTLWSNWYPGATAQLFPIVDGVIPAQSPQAQALWSSFSATYVRGWESLNDPDGFAWAVVGDAAVLMNDTGAAATYFGNVQKRYADSDFSWPWYCAESGWYLRAMNQLQNGYANALADN